MRRTIIACLVITTGSTSAIAQDAASRTAEIDARTALTQAETSRINAEAEPARARVSSLGLPSFQDKATLEGDAGKMETMQMASRALADAAVEIAPALLADKTSATTGKEMILLTDAEPFDLGLADSISQELAYIDNDLVKANEEAKAALNKGEIRPAPQKPAPPPRKDQKGTEFGTMSVPGAAVGASAAGGAVAAAAVANPAALVVAGIGAVAGLMRTETTVSGFGVTEMDDAMLIRSLAAARPNKFIVPGAVAVTLKGSEMLTKLNTTSAKNDKARQYRNRIAAVGGKTPGERARAVTANLELAIARFEAFFKRVTTANAAGRLPIIEAARLDGLRGRSVARVHVDRAGGSLVNTKNIATFFGADPIKITAGLVVSYMVTQPESGLVSAAGMVSCRTAMTRLRSVQEDAYRTRNVNGSGKGNNGLRAYCMKLS